MAGQLKAAALTILLACVACAPALIRARGVVFTSGARMSPEVERLEAAHKWTLAVLETISCRVGDPRIATPSAVGWEPPSPPPGVSGIRSGYCRYPGSVIPAPGRGEWGNPHLRLVQDPSVHVHTVPDTVETYPWETLDIEGDTARVRLTPEHPDSHTSYTVYAFLHLVHRQGRIEDWLPEARAADGLALERAIVKRMAETWLLGRSAFLLEPHPAMDALLRASESGYLDAFLLTARPGEFAAERARWLAADPDGPERYRQWFRTEFGTEPPAPALGAIP
jgi:hypothetical protein